MSLPRLTRHRAARLFGDETGAATAEYAIATMVRPLVLTERPGGPEPHWRARGR
jgi:hypothetical protein